MDRGRSLIDDDMFDRRREAVSSDLHCSVEEVGKNADDEDNSSDGGSIPFEFVLDIFTPSRPFFNVFVGLYWEVAYGTLLLMLCSYP